MSEPPIRVLICEDHTIVREGLENLLGNAAGIEVVGSVGDGAAGVELARELQPDVVLMDLSMSGLGGVDATRTILAERPAVKIVVLTSSMDSRDVVDAVDAGAIGFVYKDAEASEIVEAIHAASRGDAPLDPRAARVVLARAVPARPAAQMTSREREVLGLVGAGMANKVIAVRLGISEATVKAHLTQIYRRIGVSDRTQAALWASRNGLSGT